MAKPRVMLVYPHPGLVRHEFMQSVMECGDLPQLAATFALRSGPQLSMTRNIAVHQFLAYQPACDWLWMVDSDVAFSRNTLPALLDAADPKTRPVMSALTFMQPAVGSLGALPTMYEAVNDGGHLAFRHVEKWPAQQVIRVSGVGTGCLLVHRDVFAATATDEHGLWFAEMTVEGHQVGEDLSFCLRCADAQIPVHCHTGVMVGHVKPVMLGQPDP